MTVNLTEFHGTDCANLVQELQALLVALASKTNQKICDEAQALFDLMAEGDGELSDRLNSLEQALNGLTNMPDFSQQIINLKNLVDSLDLNEDGGVVDDLLNIQTKADAALQSIADLATRTEDLETRVEGNSTLAQNLSQSFNNFQLAINATLESLSQRLAQCEVKITALTEKVDNLNGHAASEVYCAISNAIQAGADAMLVAIDQALDRPCDYRPNVSSNASSDTSGDAAAASSGAAPNVSFGLA